MARFWFSRPAVGPQAPAFDVVVDLAPGALPLGTEPEQARAAAMAAVERLAGAMRVRVRLAAPGGHSGIRVFPAGRSAEGQGGPWSALRERVADAVQAAIAAAARPLSRSAAASAPTGFAEAPLALSPTGALAALADLAQSFRADATHPPRADTTPPQSPAMLEADRMARLLDFVLPSPDRRTAEAAVARFGSFAAVLAAPALELQRVPGLGPHTVAAIKLVHEAAVRLARAGVTGQPVLDDKPRLDAYLAAALARERIEQFRILFLDARGMLKADEVQATGTVNHTPVYPREVVRRALELDAHAVILVHNHPSGDPTPSADDIAMTGEIAQAAAALGLVLRDHIIVGNGRTLSFAEAGLIA